jgi:hypothetical protein
MTTTPSPRCTPVPALVSLPLMLLALATPLAARATPAPLPPPPAPTYPPPPPRYQGGPPPFAYPFQPPEAAPAIAAPDDQNGVRRPISFTASVGPGMLFGPGERQMALSYQLFRVGVGIDRNLSAVLGYESTGTDSVNPATDEDSWLKQDIWSLGLAAHLLPQLYFRGIMGIGHVSEKTASSNFSGGRGITVGAAVGYELLQMRHLALALDLHGSYTHYARESWKTTGLELAVSFF